MHKRQDARIPFLHVILFVLTTIILSLLVACLPLSESPKSAATSLITEPLLTPTLEAEARPTIAGEPTSPQATITATPDCRLSNSDLLTERFISERLDRAFNVIIYLPPCYSENVQQGFPVLYLLHGLSYTNDQWLRLGLKNQMDDMIAQGELPPFIIILPEESPIEPPQMSSFPDILTKELIPWIDNHYNTLAEKPYRGIGGLSRGAAWAVQIGFEHPSLFCCVGAHSLPLFQADGGKIDRWLTQNPIEELPRVLIDIGRDDQEWPTAQSFANQLDSAHVPHEWYLFNSGHTEAYWSDHLDLYLQWYARNW